MACRLPFNQITFNGALLAGPADFVYGTGTLNLKGEDQAVTTADGAIHNYRSALTPDASCELRGDKRLSATGAPSTWLGKTWPSVAGAVKLEYVASRGAAAETVKEFTGILSAEFDSSTNKTSVNITGCEAAY